MGLDVTNPADLLVLCCVGPKLNTEETKVYFNSLQISIHKSKYSLVPVFTQSGQDFKDKINCKQGYSAGN